MTRTFSRLALALCLLLTGTAAGTRDQPLDEELARIRELYFEEGPRAALPELERILTLYREAGDRRGEAITLGYIGNCHKRFGDFPVALDYLNRALALKREIGDRSEEGKTLSHLGLVFWEMGEYSQAIRNLELAIDLARELGDPQLAGSALNNLGLVYDEQGDYRRSLEQYQEALELYSRIDFPRGEGDTLGNIGGVHLLLGRYREAADHYRRALAISERLELKTAMSQDLGNLALSHLGLGEVNEALAAFDRALGLAREAGLKQEEAFWLNGKAECLMRLGRYDQALELQHEALELYERVGAKGELISALGDAGSLHLLLGDLATAEERFRRALGLARTIGHARGVTLNLLALGDIEWRRRRFEEAAALYGEALDRALEAEDRGLTAESLLRRAIVHRDQGLFDQALSGARRGLEAARKIEARFQEAQAHLVLGDLERLQGHDERALEEYSAAESVLGALGDPDLVWRVQHGRAKALDRLGRKTEAIEALEQAVATIEGVRSRLRESRFRTGYVEDKFQVYVDLVRLLLELGRVEEAFSSAERLRARSYLDLLDGGTSAVRSEEWRREEEALKARIRRLQEALEKELTSDASGRRQRAAELFSAELLAAERAYQQLLDDLLSIDPAATVQSLQIPDPDRLRKLLEPEAALLEYVVGEDGLAVFVLRREALFALTVPLGRTDLEAKVELLRDLLLRAGSDDWRLPAASLGEALIRPAQDSGWLEGVSRIYLVPHGILHHLPFALLPSWRGERGRSLVQDLVLVHLPSAAALAPRTAVETPPGTLLALSPRRSHLRFAVGEVESLEDHLPAPRRILTGRRATEGAFKRLAGEYRILHLATHGYFNRHSPMFSGLVLEPDGLEDGRLETHEILRLRLAAELVTLSACDSALASGYFAEVPAADDFVGLTRAFLLAGGSSVLASLWEVDDRSTRELMGAFYGQLERRGPAEALARAQRRMLDSGGPYAHPFFWAPFVLVGPIG